MAAALPDFIEQRRGEIAVQNDVVWAVATHDLPPLVGQLRELMSAPL